MTKLGKKIFWGCCFFAVGICVGAVFYRVNFYCVDIISPKTPFYGVLAQKISSGLQKRGYLMHCPTMFPKTVFYFYNTNGKSNQMTLNDSGKDTNILIHGDCLEGTDINYLKKFDAILAADEFLNGFISTSNLRTAYLALTEKNEKFCQTDFNQHKIDTEVLAQRLDDIIQGIRHEKF